MSSNLRNTSLSIHYRIFQILDQAGWKIVETDVDMEASTVAGDPANTFVPTEDQLKNEPWVFMDADRAIPMPSGVQFYDGGVPLPSGTYTTDFLNSKVTFDTPPTGAVTADLMYYTARVTEGYPDDETMSGFTEEDLPIIAYQMDGENADPWAIGTGLEDKHQPFTISILANSEGQLQDLGQDLRRRIRAVLLYDMSTHQFIGEDGDIDPLFDAAGQFLGRPNWRQSPSLMFIQPTMQSHPKEKWKAEIKFEIDRIE